MKVFSDMRKWKKVLCVIFLAMFCTIVIADPATDVLVQNEMSIAAEAQELQGIQGAAETSTIAQKTKIRKSGKQGEKSAQSLEKIQKDKLPQYKVINGAFQTQQDLYAARGQGNDAQASSLSAKLRKEIPQAKEALKKLEKLTAEEVSIIKKTTRDANAIKTAEATYSGWKSVVDALKEEPLTDQELQSRRNAIQTASKEAVEGAHDQAKALNSKDLADEDRKILKNNVVGGAKNVFAGMESIMSNMASVMQKFVGEMQKGGMPQMDANSIKGLQSAFEEIGKGMQEFMGSYGPFAQTVASLVGEEITVPTLSMPDFGAMLSGGKGLPGKKGLSLPSLPFGLGKKK